MDPQLVKLLLLARLVAYMLLIYLGFGLIVELTSRKPESKLRGFAHLLCRPLVRPVAARMSADAPYLKQLQRTLWIVLALWLVLVVGTEALHPRP